MKKPIISGIYQIINLINFKSYIGSSKNIQNRWNQHKSMLKYKNHHSPHLQRSWDKYGKNNFKFIVLEENVYGEQELINAEISWIKLLKPIYNIADVARGNTISNHPNKDLIIAKIRNSLLLLHKNKTIEEKEQFRLTRKRGENHPGWNGGRKRQKCKDCHNFICNKAQRCINCSKIQQNIDRKLIEYSHQIEIEINGIKYKSITDASKKLDIPKATITYRLDTKQLGYNYCNRQPKESKYKCSDCGVDIFNNKAKKCKKCDGNAKKPVEINGTIYESRAEAARQLHMNAATIRNRIIRNEPGYKYVETSNEAQISQ